MRRAADCQTAVALGIVSHLVLDVATHAPDIALWPGSPFPQLGLGLYSGAPSAAFVVELLYGVLCWWIYRGSRTLLAVLVAGNLADVSFFFAGIAGPEQFFAGHPTLVVTVVFGQIVTMLVLAGFLSSRPPALSSVRTHTAFEMASFMVERERRGGSVTAEAHSIFDEARTWCRPP